MNSRPSLARYLCAILMLKQRYYCVRSVDLAHYLKCSKPSVSVSVRRLTEEGFIQVEENGALILTPEGEKQAEIYMERLTFFQEYLMKAGIDAFTAEQEALAIGHIISDSSFSLLKKCVEAQKK